MQGGSKSGWSLVGRSGSFILKRLAKFVGSQFLSDLAMFFTEFHDILGGFKKRAEETFALLRRPEVGFVLVSSPELMAVQEALYFHERLRSSEMPFSGFVVNRVHTSRPAKIDVAETVRLLGATPAVAALGMSGTSLKIAAEAMIGAHADLEVLAAADQQAIAKLRAAGGAGARMVQVPFLREDVHDVARLIDLGRYLVG
jgi:anion-transporting  ArsA/GET3 family ATPase